MNDLEMRKMHWYWGQVGGTLVEEFPIVSRSPGGSRQVADGVIALVAQDDAVLRRLLEAERNMKVVVCPDLRAHEVEVGGALLDEETSPG